MFNLCMFVLSKHKQEIDFIIFPFFLKQSVILIAGCLNKNFAKEFMPMLIAASLSSLLLISCGGEAEKRVKPQQKLYLKCLKKIQPLLLYMH